MTTERKVTLTWQDLTEILHTRGQAFREEEVAEITLTKPKQMILRLRKKTNGNKGA